MLKFNQHHMQAALIKEAAPRSTMRNPSRNKLGHINALLASSRRSLSPERYAMTATTESWRLATILMGSLSSRRLGYGSLRSLGASEKTSCMHHARRSMPAEL
jgi:hypothetical protein